MIRYNDGNDLIEIRIKDSTGRILEKWVCSLNSKKQYQDIISRINKKYGFDLMFFSIKELRYKK